jgi:hypothetical protein
MAQGYAQGCAQITMPDRYPTATANKSRDTTQARQLRQDAAPCGVFRCDRCDRVVPEALLVVQDGYSFCRTLCADETSVSEATTRLAEQLAAIDSYLPNNDPPVGAFVGVVVITSTPTFPVTLINSGAAVAMVFGGVNFASDVTITYGAVGISDNTAPVITSTSITLDVLAEGVATGLYNLVIGDYTYTNAIRVSG